MAFRWMSGMGITRPVAALSIGRTADALGNSVLFIVIPLYVARIPDRAFHLPVPVLVGILLSAYGLVNSILQPLGGALSDRLGRRKVLIQAGLVLMCVATFAFIPANRYLDLLALRIVQGIGLSLTVPATMALLTSVTRKETRGGAMGFYTTGRMTGFAVGPLIGGALKDTLGFNAAFILAGGLLAVALLVIQLWVTDAKTVLKDRQPPAFRLIDRSLVSPGILSAALATFLMANAFSMVTTLENEFNARLGMNALGFGFAFSALMISRLVFQVPLGRLSDIIGRKPLVFTGLLLMAPATALLGVAGSETQLVLIRLLQGVAAAGIAAPAFAVAGDLSRAGGEGRQLSLVTMGFGLGIAVGPLLAGLLGAMLFELPFLIGGAMSLIGAFVVLRHMPETIERRGASSRRRSGGE